MLEKIRLWILNRYAQSFIRTFGLWVGTVTTAIGVDPELASRFANDLSAVLAIVVPYVIVQLLSFMNAKKKDQFIKKSACQNNNTRLKNYKVLTIYQIPRTNATQKTFYCLPRKNITDTNRGSAANRVL